jgi:hypothetical protein
VRKSVGQYGRLVADEADLSSAEEVGAFVQQDFDAKACS